MRQERVWKGVCGKGWVWKVWVWNVWVWQGVKGVYGRCGCGNVWVCCGKVWVWQDVIWKM